MWQQAFRDVIKAERELAPMHRVILLDLADQLYAATWTTQRRCTYREMGQRCATSKDTAFRAVQRAMELGYLTKKTGKAGEPTIFTPVVPETALSRYTETTCLAPSETQDLCSSVSSEDCARFARAKGEFEEEAKKEEASDERAFRLTPGSPEFEGWERFCGKQLCPNINGEYWVPSRWPPDRGVA